MDDTISRQAAIEAIEEMQIPIMRSEFSDEQLIFTGMSEALAAIKELPSAQPEVRTQMSVPDCISRQAAIDALLGITAMRNTIPLDSAIFNIKKLPSAEPEIILCKDCKYWKHWYADRGRCFLWHENGIGVFRDGFCNYAKRRTDEQIW